MKIVVGSRGSKLALSQTNWVVDKLKENNPEIDFEIKIIKTKGDKIQNIALEKIGDKGLFVKEIEEALLNKEIDIAVHSMKDMPSDVPMGLKFSCIPKREDARDVLILREGYNSIDDLPQGAKIGTGSKRRKYQLLRYRNDLNIVAIRGNVDTRIRKIDEENLDGIVLAAAGMHRLGLYDKISCYIPVEIMIPAPSQGALCIQIRENEEDLEKILKCIDHENTRLQVKAERAFLKGVNGSCHIPIGALCEINGDKVVIEGLLGNEDGSIIVRKSISGNVDECENLGYKLSQIIVEEMRSFEG
ncbi:hydroxymethylbilane synthase [Alkalithermobacter paradoxus]|uniref:Porphobilinogen deaminase n=1 Tax=Alkalithermobacter paradoxus TaxID=29349 RepID=A0A1V4I7U8_9FIRM|nr:porphobilinogen deaminase [[Clostridium] thermoalcaliphilum]